MMKKLIFGISTLIISLAISTSSFAQTNDKTDKTVKLDKVKLDVKVKDAKKAKLQKEAKQSKTQPKAKRLKIEKAKLEKVILKTG